MSLKSCDSSDNAEERVGVEVSVQSGINQTGISWATFSAIRQGQVGI